MWHQMVGAFRNAIDAAPASGYIGPGDIYGPAFIWCGLRGFSAAYSTGSNPAIEVVDTATGLISTIVNIKADGSLDTATILGLGYAVSVKKFYDQSGNNRHLSTASLAAMPGLNTGGMLSVTVTNSTVLASSAVTLSQPFSISIVASRVADASGNDVFFLIDGNTGFALQFAHLAVDGKWAMSFGTVLSSSVTFTLNTPTAGQGLANGASSKVCSDGTTDTGNAGTGGSSSSPLDLFSGSSDNVKFTEGGYWSGDTSASFSTMNTNQHNYWSF